MDYTNFTNATQAEKARPDQVPNNAGGYTFAVGSWERLRRFLVLGTEGGTYYVGERSHTRDNVDALAVCLDEDARKTVDVIVEISEGGRAPRQDETMFALAWTLALTEGAERASAAAAISRVCRTGSHVLQLASTLSKLGKKPGSSRALRRGFRAWYESKSPTQLAYQTLKYQSRYGFSHRDLVRLTHPKPNAASVEALWAYVLGKRESADVCAEFEDELESLETFRRLHAAKKATEVVATIRERGATWEMVPSEFLREKAVWEALVGAGIPLTALVRNLGRMSAIGLLAPLSNFERHVAKRLTDGDAVRKSRIHPIKVLLAQATYARGKGGLGSLTWPVCDRVVEALEETFQLAFHNVEPAGKRHLLALDVSGSMGWGAIAGTPITPREAAAAMALVQARTEPNVHTVAFQHAMVPFTLTARDTVRSVVDRTSKMSFGATDCAQPMLYALEHNLEVDTFVVYTDNETWFGKVHPFEALERYRRKLVPDAKLVVVGMTATRFTIANPNDRGQLDVVGFDSATPALIANFAGDRI